MLALSDLGGACLCSSLSFVNQLDNNKNKRADNFVIKKLNLKENERIVKIVRCYPLTYFFPILATFILIATPFFFLFLFFSWGLIGLVIFLGLIFLGIIYGAREFVLWYFNVFVITNQRIVDIDQRGFFDRIVSEAPFEKIQDISYRIKGIFQTLFHYGNIQIQTAGTALRLELKNIYQPEKVQELITYLIKQDQKLKSQSADSIISGERVDKIPLNDFEFLKKKIVGLDGNQLAELDKKIKEEMRGKMIKSIQNEEEL